MSSQSKVNKQKNKAINFRISHNSLQSHFSYFNPYSPFFQPKTKMMRTPGPGDYNISLPMVKPQISTIKKNDNVIILKIDHNSYGTSPFKSKIQRFKKQQITGLGPGSYIQIMHRLDSQQRQRLSKKKNQKKQQDRVKKMQEIRMLLRRQKVSSIRNYDVNKIVHSLNQSRQQQKPFLSPKQTTQLSNPKLIQRYKSYIPSTKNLNKIISQEKQRLPVFNQSVDISPDPYHRNKSLTLRNKMTNTFYNRQLLDVILGRQSNTINTNELSFRNQDQCQQDDK